MSPTFNSNKIFDSLDSTGANVSTGCLWVQNYTSVRQPIHFEGENGNYILNHGYPDMDWTYEGVISGTTLTDFNSIIIGIQSAIDDGAAGNYRALVDSFGNHYANAQVVNWGYVSPPKSWIWFNSGTLTTGYMAKVRVTGIIQGVAHTGASS